MEVIDMPLEQIDKEIKVKRCETNPNYGLNAEQINERIQAGAINSKVDSSTKTVSEIVKSNVLTYFNFVFLILAVLLIIAGAWKDLIFLPIIIANTHSFAATFSLEQLVSL